MDMVQPKTVVVGAGSHLTPRLVSDFILCEELSGSTVVLVDVDAVRLKIMEQLAHRMVSETGADLRLESTTRCGEALENADFVINTIAAGNHLEAWELDMEIPAKYGVYQSVGDTVGPGGLSRALRTIPVVLDICRDMEDLCPKAYLINFTNPMSCICRAVNRATKIEVIGLCHALYGALRFLARVFEADVDEVEAQAAGVNHLTWILSLRLRGRDAYPTLKERLSHPKRPDLLNRYVHSFELFKVLGYFPIAGDRHVCEFFPYFLRTEAQWLAFPPPAGPFEKRMKLQQYSWSRLVRYAKGELPVKDIIRRSGEVAVDLISAITHRKDKAFAALNVPNRGAFTNLPEEAVLEMPAVADESGTKRIELRDMPIPIDAITQFRIAQQELTVEAALTGDRNIALQALLLDPLTPSIEVAENILDELLEAHSSHLPQFH